MTQTGTQISFEYDLEGLRTEKTVNGVTTRYTYLDGKLTGMTKGNDVYHFYYDALGPSSFTLNTTRYYYLRNMQGDIVGIINASGSRVVSYRYDAWGKLLSISGSLAGTIGQQNPLRYRGYIFDSETGFYYVTNRYYNPETSRWINVDSIDNLGTENSFFGHNLFVYCVNNPVNRYDVEGEWSLPNWAKIAIGAVALTIGVVATAIVGGAVAPVLIASMEIAASSSLLGCVSGAVTNAVGHRISTGSWQGVGEAAWSGAIDGACEGFMWGGLTAGLAFTSAASNGLKVKEIGKLAPTSKPNEGYPGIKYEVQKPNGKYTTKSIELHSPHGGGPHNMWHWQQNTWSTYSGITRISGKAKHWTIWGEKM